MAEISQIKLPNGDVFDLVDETSGYKKFHIVKAHYLGADSSVEATYADICDWIDNNEIVIIYETRYDEYYYLYSYDFEPVFYSLTGKQIVFAMGEAPLFIRSSWLTLDTLPIYDGTVE